jgi:hypothetical protein
VTLSLRIQGWMGVRRLPMRRVAGYEYAALVPDSLGQGMWEYAITVTTGELTTTWPGAQRRAPWEWDYQRSLVWSVQVVPSASPVVLFDPAPDVKHMAFTRIGDGGRSGLFRVVPSGWSGLPAFHMELPSAEGARLDDYTASLIVRDRIGARRAELALGAALAVRARGLGARQVLHVTLVEADGTSWSAPLAIDSAWSERSIPLTAFVPARGVTLPAGFPGRWNYWIAPASGRGGAADALQLADVERLQFSLRSEPGAPPTSGAYGVEIEWVGLRFR